MLKIRKIFILATLLLAQFVPGVAAGDGDGMALRKSSNGKIEFSLNTPPAGTVATQEALVDSSSYTVPTLRAVGLLLLVGGTGLLLVWRKRRAINPKQSSAPRMKLVERLPLGLRSELLMVRAGERLLVIGCQANQMALLSDTAADAAETASFSQALFENESKVREPKQPLPPPPIEQVRDTVSIGAVARGKGWPGLENAS